MSTTVIIPTCSSSRIPLLIQTVESIQAGKYKDVQIVIVADGNPYIYEVMKISKGACGVIVILNIERKDWIFSINRVLKEFDSEYYIYASDDLVFPRSCIKHAMAAMQKHFPDGHGVVSIARKGRCTFGLFGRMWAEHFPDREVFCPDFTHFGADSELLRTVKELGNIAYLSPGSWVKHLRKKDETWRLAHRIRARDREIFHERQAKGYKWGIDFNLVTRE